MSTDTLRYFNPAKLRYARRRELLTQEQLGKLVGLSRDTINAIETGRRAPQLHVVTAIAVSLGKSADHFYEQPDPE
jgi:putative transcriptional regulator